MKEKSNFVSTKKVHTERTDLLMNPDGTQKASQRDLIYWEIPNHSKVGVSRHFQAS